MGLLGFSETERVGNCFHLGARECGELCISFRAMCSKEFLAVEVRKHSFDTRQRDGAHALWFTTTLPEATPTVATTASKLQ